eukprot:8205131-Pyramimonas_sp.AAC.1
MSQTRGFHSPRYRYNLSPILRRRHTLGCPCHPTVIRLLGQNSRMRTRGLPIFASNILST